jgi:hypothetical protein
VDKLSGREVVQEAHAAESPVPSIHYPSDERLETVLSIIFSYAGNGGAVTERERFENGGFFSSEVVKYRLRSGKDVRLFCKYSSDQGHRSFGHRGGGSYEAAVYRMLQTLNTTSPKLHGTFVEKETARVWLVLEYVTGLRVNESVDPTAGLKNAARWIGDLHRRAGVRVTVDQTAFLKAYDLDYYAAWADRTSSFAGGLHARYPWLQSLCDKFSDETAQSLMADRVLIHGEYYPKNILVDGKQVCPVDWETAAVGAGEIDLAALIEGWPNDIATACEEEYRRARNNAEVTEFQHRLDAARLYLTFRWLGDRPEWTRHPDLLSRFDDLKTLGTRLGLI